MTRKPNQSALYLSIAEGGTLRNGHPAGPVWRLERLTYAASVLGRGAQKLQGCGHMELHACEQRVLINSEFGIVMRHIAPSL